MSNNLFYKTLSIIGTLGIVVLSSTGVLTSLKKGNNADDQLSKTIIDIKNARKDALSEVKSIRAEVLKEIDTLRLNTLNELKSDRTKVLIEVKAARAEALKELTQAKSSNPEKVWLLLRFGSGAYAHLQKVPMIDMTQCEMQGAIYTGSQRLHPKDFRGFECIESE